MGKKSKNETQSSGQANQEADLNAPLDMTQDEYEELVQQVAELSEEEAREEWLESCRYGEVDAVRALVARFPSLVQHEDDQSGNTGLHMSAANGHVAVAKLLLRHKHGFPKNKSGNTPLHWAASNGQSDFVEFLTSQNRFDVDVLEKNDFGRSALTEGFTSENEGVLKSLLEHDSASEEKLLSTDGKSGSYHIHKLFDKDSPLLIRELAMANADNPFADTERPDQDTTGFSIWSAALVMARWLNTKSWDDASVLELGSGCGVPGLAIAVSKPPPKQVFVTDLNPKTVENLGSNIELNELENVQAMCMDWSDKSTWPQEQLDFVVGSDLIYQKSLVPLLTEVVMGLLKPGGTFLYVAPDNGRDGMEEFIAKMKKRCPGWKQEVAPSSYHSNPLTNEDDDECFLHFQELSSLTYILYEFPIPKP
jgi:predicted nicotinamide N-methyase